MDDIVGENGLKDIQIFEYNKDESINDYRAAYGEIHVDQATEKFSIVMQDCEMVTAMGDERVHMRADSWNSPSISAKNAPAAIYLNAPSI